MKGLEEYIEKHGRHFSEELASDVIPCKWDRDKISKVLQDKVYYNVTNSTLGDIVYLITLSPYKTIGRSINYALSEVSDYSKEGYAFDSFVKLLESNKVDFDFTYYIKGENPKALSQNTLKV